MSYTENTSNVDMENQDYTETSQLLVNLVGQGPSIDARRTSGETDSDQDVRAAVSQEDDPTMACVSFRLKVKLI